MSRKRASARYRRKEVAKSVGVFVLAVIGAAFMGALAFGLLFGAFLAGCVLGLVVGLLGAIRVVLNGGKAPDDVGHGGYIVPFGGGGDGG